MKTIDEIRIYGWSEWDKRLMRHTPSYQAGCVAAKHGCGVLTNPYEEFTFKHNEWLFGYKEEVEESGRVYSNQ